MIDRVFYGPKTYKYLGKVSGGYLIEDQGGNTWTVPGVDRYLRPGSPVMCYGVMEVWELRYYEPGMERDIEFVVPWGDFDPYNIEESKEFTL